MPGRAISDDLKEFTMKCVDDGTLTIQDCIEKGAFSLSTAKRLRREWLANGMSLAPKKRGGELGRPRKMSTEACQTLQDIVVAERSLYLTEIQQLLESYDHGHFTTSLIARQLKRMGLTRKIANCYSHNRSDELRTQFRHAVAQYTPNQLVFVDESSFDCRITNRSYARSMRNTLAYQKQRFQRGIRYSLLPACSLENLCFAPFLLRGSITGEAFYHYLEHELLPYMNPHPESNSVLICDNASVHKAAQVEALLKSKGEWQRGAAAPTD